MQFQVFSVRAGDTAALDEANRFLRGHRVLSVDRVFDQGAWHLCVCYLASSSAPGSPVGAKLDYRQVLDPATFALFSRLREVRKALAEKENVPAYAVLTNEQLAELARLRPANSADLLRVSGLGEARVDKYGGALLEAVARHAKQPNTTGAGGGSPSTSGGDGPGRPG